MSGERPTAGREQTGAGNGVKSFEYPLSPGAAPRPAWDGWAEVPGTAAAGKADRGQAPASGQIDAQIDAQIEAWIENRETREAFEAGRERGRQEGLEREREAQDAARRGEEERNRQQIAKLIADLSADRERFFQAVEPEVVKLALAVAARILRREAQMDPLLLMGAVRVALGQLSGTTEVTLRVPAGQYNLWAEALALAPNLPAKPKIVAIEGMRLGECAIESQTGTADLGIRSQLGEIERGFFDTAGAKTKETSEKLIGPGSVPDEAEP